MNNKSRIIPYLILVPVSLLLCLSFNSCEQKNNSNTGYISREEANIKIDSIISQIHEPRIPSDTINIVEFSGFTPGTEDLIDFRPWIQLALDSLYNMGGGWLHIPNSAGLDSWIRYTETYRIEGPIQIRSNTGLLIDRSVRLLFPFDPEKYLVNGKGVLTRYEGTTIFSFSPLIRAFNAENIAIKARGSSGAPPEISGEGEKWQQWIWEGEQDRLRRGLQPAYQLLKDINNQDVPIQERIYTDPNNDYFRPETMEFFLCKNVLVDGVKITNSPFWCVKPVFSESCIFRNMSFDAMVVNNDGIDPESSRNILIENIMFANHDDNVAIKAGRDKEGRDGALINGTILENIDSRYINKNRLGGPTENVVIRNCHFYGHYAICIGSEMSGSVRNVYAVDNYSVKTVNMGVFIKSSRLRGGTVENIYIHNLNLNATKNEVISLVPNYDDAENSPYPPKFKNIQIEAVKCNSSGEGILIHGWFDEPVENVLLKDLQLNGIKNKKLNVNQSLNIILDNVRLNEIVIDSTINEVEEGSLPPGKI